jgi:hypothetical protein
MKETPFLVERNFLPPMLCEQIIGDLKIDTMFPTFGQDGKPKSTILHSRLNTQRILSLFEPTVEELERKYNTEYMGTHNLMFEWYPTNYVSSQIKSDGYIQKRDEGWVRYNLIDFTGILWLNNFNDKPDFDENFEVRGGQLEFPMFDISFQPERGTLVLFPTAPNFAHTVAPVQIGSLTQVRFQIRSEVPYKFNKEDFEMNPDNWNL